MKPLSPLIDSADPDIRELLESARDEAPGPHLLPALSAALGVGAASLVSSSTTASVLTLPHGTRDGENGADTSLGASTGGGHAAGSTLATGAVALPAAIVKALVAGVLLGGALYLGVIAPIEDGRSTSTAVLAVSAGVPAASVAVRSTPLTGGVDPAPLASNHAPLASLPSSPAPAAGSAESLDSDRARPGRRTRPVAPSQGAPAASVDAGALAAEVRRIRAARRMLGSGDAASALAALDDYDVSSPRGVLGPEALVLRIEALIEQGDPRAARDAAEGFLARYPADAHAARVRKTLKVLAGPSMGGGARALGVQAGAQPVGDP